MSVIKVHPDEFGDIVIAYMLDMIRDEEIRPDNKKFNDFIESAKLHGMKSISYKAFLDMETTTRIKYKRIKDSLITDSTKDSKIVITKGDTDYIEEEFDRDLCKQIFRTIKEVRFKHPSKVLNEERIDKIINYCIKQKKQQEEQNNG